MDCASFERRLNELLDARAELTERADPYLLQHVRHCSDCQRLWVAYRAMQRGLTALQFSSSPPPEAVFSVPALGPATAAALFAAALAGIALLWHLAAPPPAASETPSIPGEAAVTRFLTYDAPELAADLVESVRPLGRVTREGLREFFSTIVRAAQENPQSTGQSTMPGSGQQRGGSS